MNAEKQLNDDSMEKVNGGYDIDEDGNVYYMGFGIDPESCVCCGGCIEMCPVQAIRESGGVAVIDYDLCLKCLECINICPVGAIGDYRKVILR